MTGIEWRDGLLPVSTRFDDLYYSAVDGRAETGHVFIGGNRLEARWPQMKHCKIAELGFGTGLNFLETVRRWRDLRPKGGKLTFISFEQFPLAAAEMTRALSRWPELATSSARLAECWSPEFEILDTVFEEDVHLTVFLGDANIRLPQLSFLADAWYLDGFAPARNPELWNEDLLAEVGRHTAAGGTFSTYSAAGFVRRSLEKCGFLVEKSPGFANKREMLHGKMTGDIDVANRH